MEKLTCKELRDIAKELNITGRWNMTKQELITAITEISNVESETTKGCDIGVANETQSEGSQKVRTTNDYLGSIQPGTLVAFKRNKNKDIAMSGKFVSFEGDKVVVESKQGTLFKLNPDCIIWVKTGTRWPKWVYSLFSKAKEVTDDNAVSEVEK